MAQNRERQAWPGNVAGVSFPVAYDFLATEDVNKDKIQDILFLYKNTNSSRGNSSLSCADEGFSCPCTFVAAVSGANGSILWERPVAQDGAFVECGVLQPRGSAAPSACIVLGRPGPLVAVDTLTGKTLWSQPSSFGGNASILSPLLRVPDLDADGAPDLLVLVQEENQVLPHPSCAASPSGLWPGGELRDVHTMTDGKDLEAEIHPLKSENRKVPENTGGPAGKEPRGTPAPQTRLSRCRTAAFFLSLFTCLLVVFVVSFIIPCPDRPASQGVWRIDYNAAGVNGYIYSGGTGQQVSPPDSLGVEGTSGSILHVTRAGAHYVLVPCGTALCSRSVKGLYEKVSGRDSSLKSDPLWEDMLSATSHRLLVHSSGAIRYLMNVPGKAGDDLLLVSAEACMLLDGQDLTPRWTFGTTQVLRKPVLGHYKPNTPAVLVENGTGSDRQVLLLDLGSGALLWSQALPGLPGDPPSASLPTADHRSAFFFWGVHKTTGSNQTEPGATGRRLYMLHPTLPSVLLELDSVSAPIVAFQVVLLELGRHAACVLLTGPASPNPPGLVSVTKQKVQDLVLGGRVVRLAEGGPESDQAVRDRLSRLRYRSEA
ncbi:FAM234A [Cervus elaphus hippelaphus]|uniref:FAM234A n=1 Tax=Cervus elaphus hippelaphus TaxID=46360 RepID=A0A212CYJ7_CEREH|nr:FAM234A [Cervus elaphus hippelaphus]